MVFSHLNRSYATFYHQIHLKSQNRKTQEQKMDDTKTKLIKLALVCLICVSLVTGLVYLIQFLTS